MGGIFSSQSHHLVNPSQIKEVMSQEEQMHLLKIYNQLKRYETMSLTAFQKAFLPENAPPNLVTCFYQVYAKAHMSKEINFDDFLEIYYLLTIYKKPNNNSKKDASDWGNKKAYLYFYICKMHELVAKDAYIQKERGDKDDTIRIDTMLTVGIEYFGLTVEAFQEFKDSSARSILTKDKISLFLFEHLYEKHKNNSPFFTWLETIGTDYVGTLNSEKDRTSSDQVVLLAPDTLPPGLANEIQQQNKFNSRLSSAKTPLEPESLSARPSISARSTNSSTKLFSKQERQQLEKFFHEKLVLKHDLEDSMQALRDLLSNFKFPPLLERRIMESFLYSTETHYFELENFLEIVSIWTKQTDNLDVMYGYIFDIFAKYQKRMSKQQFMEVIDIFVIPNKQSEGRQLSDEISNGVAEYLTKDQFIQMVCRLDLKLTYFHKLSTLFDVEFLAHRPTAERELEVVQAELDGETDLKEWFQKSLRSSQKDDKYYLLNRDFWHDWQAYVSLYKTETSFNKVKLEKKDSKGKGRRPEFIGNECLRLVSGTLRIKPNLLYGKDYLVVPPRLWTALTLWYGNSFRIERKIIEFPAQELHQRFSQQYQSLTSSVSMNETTILKAFNQLVAEIPSLNIVRELEVDEINLKCGRIKDDGNLPNTFRDGYFSRKHSMKFILDLLVDAFQNQQTKNEKTNKEYRFWHSEDGPLDVINYDQTIEQLGLKTGDRVYIEFQLESKAWPSNLGQIPSNQSSISRTKGCTNLGNTCFMNSALQCVANTPFMKEFFTMDPNKYYFNDKQTSDIQRRKIASNVPLWKYQVNTGNPLGYKGDFVQVFGELMGKMWDSSALFSVWPYSFKSGIGKVQPDFKGFRQHDSQEFLQTLLGALHEELNIRVTKPYIENPDNRGDNIRVRHEYWSNFLRRNWSFIVFLYYGQIKSTIVCLECENRRVIYETYSTLSLPVPNSNSLLLPIVIEALPTEISLILKSAKEGLDHSKLKQELFRQTSNNFIVQPYNKFQSQQKRDRSILINILIDQNETVSNLLQKVQEMTGIPLIGEINNEKERIPLTKFITYVNKDARRQAITLIFEDKYTLSDIGVIDRQALTICEVLTEYGKNVIQQHHAGTVDFEDEDFNDIIRDTSLLKLKQNPKEINLQPPKLSLSNESLGSSEHAFDNNNNIFLIDTSDKTQTIKMDTTAASTSAAAAAATSEEKKPSKVTQPFKWTTHQYFNRCYKNGVAPIISDPGIQPPSEICIMVFNRKLVLQSRKYRLLKKLEPVFFSQQFPLLATASTTGRELYEEVWMRVRQQLSQTVHDRRNLWWNRESEFPHSHEKKILTPFVLKFVNISGQACSLCHWTKKCFGCPIVPSEDDADALFYTLQRNTYIACEWDIEFYEQFKDTKNQEWQEHKSVQDVHLELDKPVDIDTCFQLFSKADDLEVQCNHCKKIQPSKKTMTVDGSCPPVLILHLKRFKVTTLQTLKMQNMITFPLYDLDLGKHVSDFEQAQCHYYDLFGVVNHFGSMGGGHYTSTIKNFKTGEWLYYDDSNVKTINESEVLNRSAYILFYVRKDVLNLSFCQVIPRLTDSHFAGKPIHLKTGEVGYLIEYQEESNTPYVVGLGSDKILYLSQQEILPDPDTEDLSSINGMISKKKRDSVKDKERAESGDTNKAANQNGCSIF